MVVIKDVSARAILDSRNEKTISVSVRTSDGIFSASAPNGKSKGKHEAKPYKKSLADDILTLRKFRDYFSEENIEYFDDLKRTEDVLNGFVGANTFFALQSAVLKAIAKKERKNIWELINPNLSGREKFPRLVGNCVGGGKHTNFSESGVKKPDFQEFLLIPKEKIVSTLPVYPQKAFILNPDGQYSIQALY